MSNQHEPNRRPVEPKRAPMTPFRRDEDQVDATRRTLREMWDAADAAIDKQTQRTRR